MDYRQPAAATQKAYRNPARPTIIAPQPAAATLPAVRCNCSDYVCWYRSPLGSGESLAPSPLAGEGWDEGDAPRRPRAGPHASPAPSFRRRVCPVRAVNSLPRESGIAVIPRSAATRNLSWQGGGEGPLRQAQGRLSGLGTTWRGCPCHAKSEQLRLEAGFHPSTRHSAGSRNPAASGVAPASCPFSPCGSKAGMRGTPRLPITLIPRITVQTNPPLPITPTLCARSLS